MTAPKTARPGLYGSPPSFDDITAAAQRLHGWANLTPLLESSALNKHVGGRILLKAESLQRTGSFKFRGAFNRISTIPAEERERGVVAYSSGNHAQGVAAAAAVFGIPAVIVMPSDAPTIKVANTRSYGAEVILYDRYRESREEIGLTLTKKRGATLVRPYDDPFIIAGQGTCGLEIAAQAADLDARLDSVLVCCGGGGLTAGCAIALNELSPQTEIWTVEPAGFDDTKRSIETGSLAANSGSHTSICDALLAPQPGELTFSINRQLVRGGLAVTESEVKAAVAFAFQTLKLVVEPGGAVCLAAILSQKIDCTDRTMAITLSGGNIDSALFCALLCEYERAGG